MKSMADQLYLSLWFPNFRLASLPAAIVAVLKQFSKAGGEATVSAAATYPISWNETPVFQRIFDEDEAEVAVPESAVAEATEMLHDDYAYEFEAEWELWSPARQGDLDTLWKLEPHTIRITGFGPEFDEGSYEQNGHIRIDLGTDTVFLQDEVDLDQEAAAHVQQNVQHLIDFTNAIEQNIGISSRLLWSESGENLAQKLIARLQRLN
jgi:hypothetical protein